MIAGLVFKVLLMQVKSYVLLGDAYLRSGITYMYK